MKKYAGIITNAPREKQRYNNNSAQILAFGRTERGSETCHITDAVKKFEGLKTDEKKRIIDLLIASLSSQQQSTFFDPASKG